MAAIVDRTNPERTWLTAAIGLVVVVGAGILAFPKAVYTDFVWQFFWGPIDADGHNAVCAARLGDVVRRFDSANACTAAARQGATIANPGYTLVSEAGYAVLLLFMLAGVLLLVRRLDIGTNRRVVFALIPFVLFGGALRAVEDANDVVSTSLAAAISYPANALIISPIIYVTVFVVTLVALLVSLALEDRDVIAYESALAGFGTLALVVTLGYLSYLSVTTSQLGFYPQMLVLTLGIASLIAGVVYLAIERVAPGLNAGTGYIGLAIIWAQAIDGVSNVLASDWWNVIGLPFQYSAKHPIDRIIVGITTAVLPTSFVEALGDSWPFLLVKVVLAVGVIWLFDESIFEDSPRYTYLLMLAIIVVGLGPGTRDMLRATFGI